MAARSPVRNATIAISLPVSLTAIVMAAFGVAVSADLLSATAWPRLSFAWIVVTLASPAIAVLNAFAGAWAFGLSRGTSERRAYHLACVVLNGLSFACTALTSLALLFG